MMDGAGVVRSLLVNDAAVTAKVPRERIVAGIFASGVSLPAIRIDKISGTHRNMFSRGDKRPVSQRIQIEVHAKNEPEARAIHYLVKNAVDEKYPVADGLSDVVVLLGPEGPSGISNDTSARMESQDVFVSYNEDT